MTKQNAKNILEKIIVAFDNQSESDFMTAIDNARQLLNKPVKDKKFSGIVCTPTDDGKFAWEYPDGRITICSVKYSAKHLSSIKAAANAKAAAACRTGGFVGGKSPIMILPEKAA